MIKSRNAIVNFESVDEFHGVTQYFHMVLFI